jgi:Cu-Zn family superoxide dismutase
MSMNLRVSALSFIPTALSLSLLALPAIAPAAPATATVQLEATRGNTAKGVVSFEQQGAGAGTGVLMVARVEGLKPGQAHGFHLHEKGDCGSGDGMSTGGHFNPKGHAHGPQDGEHHAGDLPALQADAGGRAELRVTLPGLSVAPGPASVVGLGLIVHAGPDDFKTQPTGNSGARIACGVVKLK